QGRVAARGHLGLDAPEPARRPFVSAGLPRPNRSRENQRRECWDEPATAHGCVHPQTIEALALAGSGPRANDRHARRTLLSFAARRRSGFFSCPRSRSMAKSAKVGTKVLKPSKAVEVKPPPTGKLAIAGGTPVSATPVPFMSTALAPADIEAAVAVLKSGMLRAA